ncbi:MAG: hypothetical protein Q7U68_02415 [Candidatus Roizmanbacteria bacterium]|nr:hypothetical protein [Candidatus Roizmanbacteria bacterium]
MKDVIVSNATPIIAFSRINRLDLFQQVTGAIVIPQEVEKELYGHRRTDVPALNRSNWIKVRKVKSQADVELLLPSLDKGEAEVIVLSKELGDRFETFCMAGAESYDLLKRYRQGWVEKYLGDGNNIRFESPQRLMESILGSKTKI